MQSVNSESEAASDPAIKPWFKRRLTRRDRWILWTFVVLSYLAAGYAAMFADDLSVDSRHYVLAAWVAFTIQTFAFHIGLATLMVVAMGLWTRRRRLVIAALPLLICFLGPSLWLYRPKSPPPIRGESIKVMCVNLYAGNTDTATLVPRIRKADPDVILVQEFPLHWQEAFERELGADYPHEAHVCMEIPFGMAIYSKRPFVEPVEKYLPLADRVVPQMRTVIQIGGRSVAIYNLHPFPPRNPRVSENQRRVFRDFLRYLEGEKLPTIIGGDFNAPDAGAFAEALHERGFRDTHTLAGWGRGSTWPVAMVRWGLPGVRPDHVYVGPDLTCVEVGIGEPFGSDHLPIMAVIGFAGASNENGT